MKIIVGHTNMDLDCIGSMVLAKYLFPDHIPVMSRLVQPEVKNLCILYRNHIDFMDPADLKGQKVERMVIVDSSTRPKVSEYFELIDGPVSEIEIYDHHGKGTTDIENARLHYMPSGANTSIVGMELIKHRVHINSKDATIALAGIYADTGNFTHDNVLKMDFDVASFLLKNGADIKLVKSFTKFLKEDNQMSMLHTMLKNLVWVDINGHMILFSYNDMDKQISGLSSVVDEIFDLENPDALFSVFHFKKNSSNLIIGRSQKNVINLSDILGSFGGGGHPKAGSAVVKNEDGESVYERFMRHLTENLENAVTAGDMMTRDVFTIRENWTLLEASIFLEDVDLSGVPVLNENGDLVGMLTLKDIMKGRKSGQMHSPVKGYMKTKLITCSPETTMREIESIMFMNRIGHLPVMNMGKLEGIITRNDYLSFLKAR